MEKKKYQQPEMKVVKLDSSAILAGSNEGLEDGGDIFGSSAKGAFFDFDEEDF